MANINDNYLKLAGSYLFRETAHRTAAYKEAHPEADVISLGIGDVTLPLPDACIQAMHKAVDEMANASTFRGYGPEQGYSLLRITTRVWALKRTRFSFLTVLRVTVVIFRRFSL